MLQVDLVTQGVGQGRNTRFQGLQAALRGTIGAAKGSEHGRAGVVYALQHVEKWPFWQHLALPLLPPALPFPVGDRARESEVQASRCWLASTCAGHSEMGLGSGSGATYAHQGRAPPPLDRSPPRRPPTRPLVPLGSPRRNPPVFSRLPPGSERVFRPGCLRSLLLPLHALLEEEFLQVLRHCAFLRPTRNHATHNSATLPNRRPTSWTLTLRRIRPFRRSGPRWPPTLDRPPRTRRGPRFRTEERAPLHSAI